jgi:hypothetical protein
MSAIEAHNARFAAAFPAMSAGYLMAPSGVLMVRWRLERDPSVLDRLATLIARNTDSPARELMWGAPGTMLIALWLYEETGEARWAELFRAGAAVLKDAFAFEADIGACAWTQELFGQRSRFVGAVHGFAGNAHVLMTGRRLLKPGDWDDLAPRIVGALHASARLGEGLANWPPKLVSGEEPPPPLLVQHCHGAPGVVTCLTGLDGGIDDLLIAGGELVWQAGPLRKGSNLCHGTGGNGYAFLKLFERTGDDLWLGRARAFAMHAIAQCEAQASELGRGRYSLVTGDLGLACYLWDCIEGKARVPTLDIL